MDRLAYSVQETAELLGLSLPTIYRMVYEGRLPSKRTGGRKSRIIIPAKSLEDWLLKTDEPKKLASQRRNSRVAKEAARKLRAVK